MDRKRLKLNIGSDGKFTVTSSEHEPMDVEDEEANKRKNPLGGNVVISSDNKFRFVPENRFERFDKFFEEMLAGIGTMGLTQINTNKIVKLCEQLIATHTKVILQILENELQENSKTTKIIKEIEQHAVDKLGKVSTQSKRLAELRKNPMYVEPKEVSLTLKWRTKSRSDSDLKSESLVQSTCQFVSIKKTLIALFSHPDFQSVYTNYNLREKHQCEDGVFSDFCCGSTYKNKEIFRDKMIIQLQLFADDFEICCPVKSKATKHKICGVYFKIRNLPPNICSKLDNIFLIALATTTDLKDDDVLHNLNELIFEELFKLETEGFQTSDNKTWKAALVNYSLDNLGANQMLGFSKSFNANYYCRLCEMSKSECANVTHEMPEKLRTKQSYAKHINILKENPSATLTDTKGVRMECLYDGLESYDIYENVSLDLMHDLHEGVVPSFLTLFFEHCISEGIANEADLIRRIRDYHYGVLFEDKIPSPLALKKSRLGQNASQSYCLILHLPFIFFDKKEYLCKIWSILEELLQILQIDMSTTITESNLKRLEKLIDKYLRGLLTLKKTLIPKEHLLTHYPNAIRKVGPLRHTWTMRFECKHKFFTAAAKITYNFININKTLAMKHQEYMCSKPLAIRDNITEAKRSKLFRDHSEFMKYETFLGSVDKNMDFNSLLLLPFLEFNNYVYKSGLVLIEKFTVFEIIFVLKSKNDYYVLCEIFETKQFERCLNSIEIRPYCPDKKLAYLKHSELSDSRSFAKKTCDGKIYVIAENSTVYDSFN